MGPSLTSTTNNVGILISTEADTAGTDQIDESLSATDDSLQGLGDSAIEVSEKVNGAMDDMSDVSKASSDEIVSSNTMVADSYKVVADAAAESAATQDESAAGSDFAKGAAGSVGLAGALSNPYVVAGAAIAGAVVIAVKSAANFQSALTVLYNTAGETANYKQLSSAILEVSDATGASSKQLASALYYISSAGYNTLSGVQILKAATEAAMEEGSNVTTVADALTTVMHDYGASASQATSYTNQLLTAVSLGKTTLQDFASALPTVLQVANNAGLSFSQVAGALATITENGTHANEAADQLRSLIEGLITPTATARAELEDFGINTTELAQNLGQEGLAGTLDQVMTAIGQNTQGGLVLLNTMQSSRIAAGTLNQELAAMSPTMRNLANEFMSGTMNMSDFRKAVPTNLEGLASEFEQTYKAANSFNVALTSGSTPAAQTFTATLKTLFPNINATQAVLALTGQNAGTAAANVDKVASSASGASSQVQGWSKYQSTINAQLDELKAKADTAAIKLGTALTPAITELIKILSGALGVFTAVTGAIVDFYEKHKDIEKVSKDIVMWMDPATTAFMAFSTVLKTATKGIDDIGGAVNSLKNLPGNLLHDIHIPGFATGVTNSAGGVATVGENGPETVILPTGSSVKTNAQSTSANAPNGTGVLINQTNYNYSQFDLTAANKELGFMLANASPA